MTSKAQTPLVFTVAKMFNLKILAGLMELGAIL